MQKYSLKDLIEFDGSKVNSKILINEHGCQMALFNISAGQSAPEYATKGLVTVGALRGHVTVHVGNTSCELHAGEVVSIEAGALHRVEAHEDSALLSLTTGNSNAEIDPSEELDLREIPRPERHPLIFAKFDALPVGGSLRLLNDHDPVPLNRQFENIRPGQALWEYIVRGPSLFRIRIRRIAPPSSADLSLGAPIQFGR